jgi:hypothetical protein
LKTCWIEDFKSCLLRRIPRVNKQAKILGPSPNISTRGSLLVCFRVAELTKLQDEEHNTASARRKEVKRDAPGLSIFAILYFVTKIQVCVDCACVLVNLRECVDMRDGKKLDEQQRPQTGGQRGRSH